MTNCIKAALVAIILVIPALCNAQIYATLPFNDGFESGSLGTSWLSSSDNGFGRVQVTSLNVPNSGSHHLTMDVNTDGNFSINEASLHLNLSGLTDVNLTFYWKEFGDEEHTEDGIFISDDGGITYTKIASFNSQNATDNTWQQVLIDLDQLAIDNALTLSSTFVIKFQQYDNNSISTDGFAFDDISIGVPVGCSPTPINTYPYSNGFEAGALGAEWCIPFNSFSRTEVSTANTPRTGTYHLAMDVSVPGNFGTSAASLFLDLSGASDYDLEFYWKEFGDEDHTDDGVYFSNDNGVTFSKVLNLNGQNANDNVWQKVNIDLDQLASDNGLTLNANFVVKFQQHDNSSITTDGFAFDDILIQEPIACTATAISSFPYSNGFESGVLGSEWCVPLNSFARTEVSTANTPRTGTYHLSMDVSVPGNFGTNEASLYLDLSVAVDYEMEFYWKEFGDEDHPDDGIYFSNDDGASFTKVLNLNGENVPNNTWQQIKIDLDQLAVDNGLILNASFVVKFQQHDNSSITTDGFAFDDILIREAIPCIATPVTTFPYSNGFETGTLGSEWCVPFASFTRTEVSTANTPNSGSYHLTMDVSTPGNFGTNEALLYLDLSGATEYDLEFYWKEFGDEDHEEDGLFISNDNGLNFTKVLALNGNGISNNTWQKIRVDLDQLASENGLTLNASFVVKFQQNDNSSIATDGFAFDDILIEEPIVCTPFFATVPFTDGFESGTLGSAWCISTNSIAKTEVTTSHNPFEGSYHLTMDASIPGNFITNEALLHISLASLTEVELQFHWKDFGDENHPEDGVYFSDDMGATFIKVEDFTSTNYTNEVWRLFKLDVDELAINNGLTLNNQFVIKFQHKDNASIGNDGFAIDNIKVFVPECQKIAASFPYNQNFESGTVGPEWCFDSNNRATSDITSENTPNTGNFHLIMDASVSGALQMNIAELNVNLSGQTDVTLDFSWKDFGDEDHAEDGIFFSDDNGATYTNVFLFNPESVTNNAWQFVSLDVAALATANSLTLNNQFVIKFQHYDNNPVSKNDGIAIDDISLYDISTSWSGANGTDWNDPTNWDNGLPDCGYLVNIPDVSGTSGNFPLISVGSDPNVGSLNIANGGQITIDPTYTLNVCSSWSNQGNSNIGTGTVSFNGTGVQSVSGFTDFVDIEMNNTGGGISLLRDQIISNNVTLNSGVIHTNSYVLILPSGATSSIGNPSSYVDGQLKKIGITDFTFAVGANDTWAPIQIANLTGDVNTEFTTQYFHDIHTKFESLLSPDPNGDLNNVSEIEYWNLDNTGTASNADITLFFNSTTTSAIDDFADLQIAHFNGSEWENLGQSSIVASDPGSITVTNVSSFSPFTFASLSALSNPLPVELTDFKGNIIDDNISLKWITSSEINNEYFQIEKSRNGNKFEPIGKINGNGTTNALHKYYFTDIEPFNGQNFYRLKQVDFDGKYEYSPIIAVKVQRLVMNLSVYPNPVQDLLNINAIIDGEFVTLSIIDLTGTVVFSKRIEKDYSANFKGEKISISSVKTGLYIVQISTEKAKQFTRILIE